MGQLPIFHSPFILPDIIVIDLFLYIKKWRRPGVFVPLLALALIDSFSRRKTYVISRDCNDRVHMLFLEFLCDLGKTLFDISVNTGQICMKFEADTPQKL